VCLCAFFRIPHDLCIGQQFIKSLGISNTHSSLGFGILLLLHWILLAFLMLILQVVRLIEKAFMVLVIFLDLLSFAGLLKNNLQLHNPPQRLSM
jgi:tryptophan-rich sensory protein